MDPHETYTAVMRHFWQCQREHSFQPSEIAVYTHLVDTCFMLEWKNPFKHANGYLCGVLGISEKTLISARNRLQQAGLVGFQSGKHRRDLSTYTLLHLEKAVNISPLRAQTLQPYGQEHFSLSGTNAPDNGRDSISLPVKEKTLSPRKNRATALPDAKPADEQPDPFPFEAFWLAYGKKEDKHKCHQRWQALSPVDRTAAMAHVPRYVASTPEKRYRKNPLTYLNGRCWLDEETPSDRTPVPVAPTPLAPLDPDALFGHTQSAAAGLAQARQSPEYQRYLAEQAELADTTPIASPEPALQAA